MPPLEFPKGTHQGEEMECLSLILSTPKQSCTQAGCRQRDLLMCACIGIDPHSPSQMTFNWSLARLHEFVGFLWVSVISSHLPPSTSLRIASTESALSPGDPFAEQFTPTLAWLQGENDADHLLHITPAGMAGCPLQRHPAQLLLLPSSTPAPPVSQVSSPEHPS